MKVKVTSAQFTPIDTLLIVLVPSDRKERKILITLCVEPSAISVARWVLEETSGFWRNFAYYQLCIALRWLTKEFQRPHRRWLWYNRPQELLRSSKNRHCRTKSSEPAVEDVTLQTAGSRFGIVASEPMPSHRLCLLTLERLRLLCVTCGVLAL